MPFLWFEESGGWAVMPLEGAAFSLAAEREEPARPTFETAGPVLVRVSAAGAKWVLLSPPEGPVRVNGEHLPGIRILQNGDEIRVGPRQLFFSAEHRARVEPFAGTGAIVCCGRCSVEIDAGSPTVRCPNCGVFHHASEERPCWTYAPGCSACEYDTRLDAEFRWTPEQL